MVSSTYYDLKQIRQDLSHFIQDDLGYRALLSEFDSFPVDPDVSTIENCRICVEHDADILVLVVGGRYGYVDEQTDKSITNIEYLSAKAKGIPVFAFIDKGILPLLLIWENNQEAKFDSVVSHNKVFQFIKELRNEVWTFEFEHAQDIVKTLRVQLAYQVSNGLQLTKQLSSGKKDIPTNISGSALRLILEKPKFWKYYFFAQVLTDEVDRFSDLRQDYQLGLISSKGNTITTDEILLWVSGKLAEALRLGHAMDKIFNEHLVKAMGEPHEPCDLKALVFTAKKIGSIYKEAIDWVIDVRQTYMFSAFQPIKDYLDLSLADYIEQVGNFASSIRDQFDKARLMPNDAQINIDIKLKITSHAGSNLAEILEKCFKQYDEHKQ